MTLQQKLRRAILEPHVADVYDEWEDQDERVTDMLNSQGLSTTGRRGGHGHRVSPFCGWCKGEGHYHADRFFCERCNYKLFAHHHWSTGPMRDRKLHDMTGRWSANGIHVPWEDQYDETILALGLLKKQIGIQFKLSGRAP